MNAMFTTAEKLDEIERLIEAGRREGIGRIDRESDEYRRFKTLKAIAKDLRGRLDGAPSAAYPTRGSRSISRSRASRW